MKNDANGKFQFSALEFDETHTTIDGQNQYTYTVKEIAGSDANMTYDDIVYTVVVTVKDNDEGGVAVTHNVTNATNGIVFTNIYNAPDNIPQTGDNSNLPLWFGLMFVSFGGLIGVTLHSKKRKVRE